jgi:hypothetical protein
MIINHVNMQDVNHNDVMHKIEIGEGGHTLLLRGGRRGFNPANSYALSCLTIVALDQCCIDTTQFMALHAQSGVLEIPSTSIASEFPF